MKTFIALTTAVAAREVQEAGLKYGTGSCSGVPCLFAPYPAEADSPAGGDCWCDEACTYYNDCCDDRAYQCYNGKDQLCPSTTCYTQSDQWGPGKDITCEMTNADCLNVSCSASGIDATFSADLFHTNLENGGTFMQQLQAGHRSMVCNGNELSEGDQCGYTVTADGVNINWNYASCGVSPTMNADEKIEYSVSCYSPGNAPGYPTIEFYVDTSVAASCEYEQFVKVDADGFWVNQEDVDAAGDAQGTLKECFDCNFYADADRNNQIGNNNIVNMGENIYGSVNAKCQGNGLLYKLSKVKFCDVSGGTDQCVDVVRGGHGNDIVQAAINRPKKVDFSVNQKFRFLSFGFEDLSNQNEVEASCRIRVYIDDPQSRSIGDDEPADEGFGGVDY